MKKWLGGCLFFLSLASAVAQNHRYTDYDGLFGPLHNNNFPSAWWKLNDFRPEEATRNFFLNWDYESSPFLLESGEQSRFSLRFDLKAPATGYHAVFMLPLGREVDLAKGLRVDIRFAPVESLLVSGVVQFLTVKNEKLNFLEAHRYEFSDSTWRREHFSHWWDPTRTKTDTLYVYLWGDAADANVSKAYLLDNLSVWDDVLGSWAPLNTFGEKVGGDVRILDYEPQLLADTLEFEPRFIEKNFNIFRIGNQTLWSPQYEWTQDGEVISQTSFATARFEERGKNYQIRGILSAPPALSRDTLKYNYFVAAGSVTIVSVSPSASIDSILVKGQIAFSIDSLRNTTGEPPVYDWTDNGVVVGSASSVTIVFNTLGNHRVVGSVTAGASADSRAWDVYVDPGSIKITGFSPSVLRDTLLIMAEETFVISSASNTTAYSVEYRFTDNGTVVGRESSVRITFNQSGERRIVGYAENTASADSVVWYREIDPGTILITEYTPAALKNTIGIGESLFFKLTYTNTTAKPPLFEWTVDGDFTGDKDSVTIPFFELGKHSVRGLVYNEVAADSVRWEVEVKQGFIRIVGFSPSVLRDTIAIESREVFRVDSVRNTTLFSFRFRWTYNGAVVGESDSLIASFRNPGDHKIIGWAGNSISADSIVWLRFVVPPTTGVRDEGLIPSTFALHQNYPNPFNPRTVISFDLPAAAFVSLKVFNLLGREVAELVREDLPAGRHRFTWDAHSFPSGTYFYRLEGGGFLATRKLVFIK